MYGDQGALISHCFNYLANMVASDQISWNTTPSRERLLESRIKVLAKHKVMYTKFEIMILVEISICRVLFYSEQFVRGLWKLKTRGYEAK